MVSSFELSQMVSRKRKNYSNLDGSGQPNQIPAFFKFFIPDTCTQRLKIPPAYAKKMQGNLPGKAFLRDRYGNIWPVELARIENYTFFVDGWETFVKDNSVNLGDFLVFQFDGHYVFDVKLMGHTGCDKNGVGSLLFSVKEEEEENNEAGEEEGRGGGGGAGEEEEEEEEEEDDEENEEEQEQEEEENLEDNYGTANETNEDEESNNEEEEEEERQVKQEAKSTKRVTKSKASRKGLKEMKRNIKVGLGKEESWRETKVDPYGFDIFKSGKIPQPKNPYFVTKIRSKRKDELYVPVDVIRDHSLDLPSKIILSDPQGRQWTTRLRKWSDGRKWYCGGWRSLCKLNLIGEKDTCICEFVKRRGGGLLIKVTSILSEDDVSIKNK